MLHILSSIGSRAKNSFLGRSRSISNPFSPSRSAGVCHELGPLPTRTFFRPAASRHQYALLRANSFDRLADALLCPMFGPTDVVYHGMYDCFYTAIAAFAVRFAPHSCDHKTAFFTHLTFWLLFSSCDWRCASTGFVGHACLRPHAICSALSLSPWSCAPFIIAKTHPLMITISVRLPPADAAFLSILFTPVTIFRLHRSLCPSTVWLTFRHLSLPGLLPLAFSSSPHPLPRCSSPST